MNLKTPNQPWQWWPRRIHAGRAGYHDHDWYLWLWWKWWAR